MWKKNETSSTGDNDRTSTPTSTPQAVSNRVEHNPNANRAVSANSSSSSSTKAFIGKSIEINGEIIANEDLIIDGKVTGKIILQNNNLKIDREGIVDADIEAKTIDIEGKVLGHVTCYDKITIRKNGDVTGDISADRVILEDGCQFKGSIDMIPAKAQAPVEKKVTQADRISDIKPNSSNGTKSSTAEFAKSSPNK